MTATAPEQAPAPPAALTILLALSAAAATMQSAVSGSILYRAHWPSIHDAFTAATRGHIAENLPELLILSAVLLLQVLAAIGLPVSALAALRALATSGGGAAKPLARFLRLALYTGALTAFLTFPGTFARPSSAFPMLFWALHVLAAIGLPPAVLVYLKGSSVARHRYGRSFLSQLGDEAMRAVSRDGAVTILLMLTALVLVIFVAAVPSMRLFGPRFLVSSEWRPNTIAGGLKHDAQGNVMKDPDTGESAREPDQPPAFGALPVIYGTTVTSVIAVLCAVPLSFGAAVFLVRVAPRFLGPPVSFLIEFLAAIPSIAYGIWGLFVLGPFLGTRFEPLFQKAYLHLPETTWPQLGLIVLLPTCVLLAYWLWIREMGRRSRGRGVKEGREVGEGSEVGIVNPWAVRFVVTGIVLAAAAAFAAALRLAYAGAPVVPGLDASIRRYVGGPPTLSWLFNYTTVEPDGTVTVRPVALTGYDMLCGGLILAIMIIPIITAISRDVLRAVPRAQVEGTAALGATWWQSSKEMLKYSRSGLFGAVMLGLARAAGETMAVTMVIGNNPQIKLSPFMAAQTMSSLLAAQFAEANDPPEYRSALFEVALILLVMSLAFNVVARYLVVGKGARTSAAH